MDEKLSSHLLLDQVDNQTATGGLLPDNVATQSYPGTRPGLGRVRGESAETCADDRLADLVHYVC